MAQYWTLLDCCRSAQRVSYHCRQCADACDRRPQSTSESACSNHLAFVLGMVVGRLRSHSGHSGNGNAKGDLRSRARLAAVGALAWRLDYIVAKAATISAISPSF